MFFSKRYKYRDAFFRVCHLRFRKRWFEISGESMAPTLHHGQIVLLDVSYYNRNHQYIQRGYIVAFKNPYNQKEIFVKRIVGLPKEFVQLEVKNIFINELPLKDFHFIENFSLVSNPISWQLETDEYFLLGDNYSDSEDSRHLGVINSQYILGIIWFRLWPPTLI